MFKWGRDDNNPNVFNLYFTNVTYVFLENAFSVMLMKNFLMDTATVKDGNTIYVNIYVKDSVLRITALLDVVVNHSLIWLKRDIDWKVCIKVVAEDSTIYGLNSTKEFINEVTSTVHFDFIYKNCDIFLSDACYKNDDFLNLTTDGSKVASEVCNIYDSKVYISSAFPFTYNPQTDEVFATKLYHFFPDHNIVYI